MCTPCEAPCMWFRSCCERLFCLIGFLKGIRPRESGDRDFEDPQLGTKPQQPGPVLPAAANCAPPFCHSSQAQCSQQQPAVHPTSTPSSRHPLLAALGVFAMFFLLTLTSLEIIALMLLTLIVRQNVFISCFFLN